MCAPRVGIELAQALHLLGDLPALAEIFCLGILQRGRILRSSEISACGNNGRGEDAVEGADPKLSRVTLESIEIRDSLNAPVDYGVRQDSADVGQVGAN